MRKKTGGNIYSGASPEEVARDLAPLVDFRDEGMSLAELSALVEERLLPHLMRYDRPSFQSMFNAFPESGAEYGARTALEWNQGVTNWQVSPGGAMLEEMCCKAICRLFGLDEAAGATFMYCGTYANQQALYMALHRRAEVDGFDLARKGIAGFGGAARLKVLCSSDAHFSLRHAARTIGIGEEGIVELPVDGNRRVEVSGLRRALDEMRAQAEAFCVVATAGTTSTGAVDPVRDIAAVCRDEDVWMHVDGAYGLAYSLVPGWNPLFAGLELADSVSWDPHKQFGVPIPNSILFARRESDFARMALHSDYFNIEESDEPNPGLKSPPSTRPLTALSLVASLLHQGLAGVRERLKAPLAAVGGLHARLGSDKGFEVLHEPDTGILCFRVIPSGGVAEERLDELQQGIYERMMAGGERTISITRIGDRKALRLVAVSPSVSADDLIETAVAARDMATGMI